MLRVMRSLICHPDTPSQAVRAVYADIARDGDAVRLSYQVDAPSGSLVWPGPGPADRRDGLWQSSCFEAFFTADPGGPYVEYNAAPSGAWAAYHFDAYRRVGARDAAVPYGPTIACDGYRMMVLAPAPPDWAPLMLAAPLRIALTAVIEEQGGAKSLWSLKHPAGKPDFHHPDGFVVLL